MKSKQLLLAMLTLSTSLCLSSEVPPGDGSEMSLQFYQKIKRYFDSLYGVQISLVPDASSAKKAEIEAALRADAAENKEVLIKALGSSKVIHRELAARTLEYCGDKKAAVEALCKVVAGDTDENVRRAAAAALAKLPDAAAVEALVKGLSDSSNSVRGLCAAALGNVKDNRAAEPLLRVATGDTQAIIRMQAATALSKINDPATLDALKKALNEEKDERVKMALAGAIRGIVGGNTDQTDPMPTAGEAADELVSLAKEMKEVEDKLRNDRHDQAVQVQGNGIEQKLMTLIEKIEKSSNNSGSGSDEKKQQQQQQKKSGSQANNGKSGGSPLADSKLGGAVPQGAVNPAMVAGRQDAWAKLPPAQRDELLQAYREDMPERWRKRLEAYFLSIAVEEVKNADR